MFGMRKNPYPKKDFKKRIEDGLKGGWGKVTIYVAKKQHEDPDVYEWGYLIISRGASIGRHAHVDDFESWEVTLGMIEYHDDEKTEIVNCLSEEMICCRGDSHGLTNIGNGEAIIRYAKFR